jgi:hypothetical protein
MIFVLSITQHVLCKKQKATTIRLLKLIIVRVTAKIFKIWKKSQVRTTVVGNRWSFTLTQKEIHASINEVPGLAVDGKSTSIEGLLKLSGCITKIGLLLNSM